MIECRRRLVVPRTPAESVVHRDHGALVCHEQADRRIERIDPIALVVVATRRAALGVPRLAAIHRLPRHGVRRVEDVGICRIDGDGPFIICLAHDVVVARGEGPALAAIVRAIQAASARGGEDDVEDAGIARRDRDVDAAKAICSGGEPLGQLLPVAAAVGALVQAAPLSGETRVLPRTVLVFPERCVNRVGIHGIDHQVGGARVLVLVQHFLPRLPAVGCAIDPALRVLAIHMPEHGGEHAIRILRIDGDARNLLVVVDPHVRPRSARIGRLVDAVTGGEVGAMQSLARAHVHDVGIRDRHVDRANRPARLLVEDWIPGAAVVRGLPDAAVHHPHIEHVWLRRYSGRGLGPSAAEWADHPPARSLDRRGVECCLRNSL